MRVILPGCLLGAVLLLPATGLAGGGDSAYGLGEPEPLDSAVVPAVAATTRAEPEAQAPSPAPAVAGAPQPFRIRFAGSPEAQPAGPVVSGLRYRPSSAFAR